MSLTKQYKHFKLNQSIVSLHNSLNLVSYLIWVVHILCLAILMTLSVEDIFKESFGNATELMEKFREIYLSSNFVPLLSYFGIFSGMFLLGNQILIVHLTPSYDQLPKHEKILKTLLVLHLTFGYLFEGLIFLILWSNTQILLQEGIISFCIKVWIPLVAYLFSNSQIREVSLYGRMAIPFTFMLILSGHPFVFLQIGSTSMYLLAKDKNIAKKLCYGFVVIFSFFVLSKLWLNGNHGFKNLQVSFLMLIILIVLVAVFILRNRQTLTTSSLQQRFDNLFNSLKLLKRQIPSEELHFRQFFQIYQQVCSLLSQNQSHLNTKVQEILNCAPQLITKSQLWFLLEKFFESQAERSEENKITCLIYLLRIQITLKYPANKMIQKMMALLEDFKISNQAQRHMILGVFDELVQNYAAFRTDSTLEVFYVSNVNRLRQEFELNLIQYLEELGMFWYLFTLDEIDRLQLDETLRKVVKKYSYLEDLYTQIQKIGGNATEKKVITIIRSMMNVYMEKNKNLIYSERAFSSSEKAVDSSFLTIENDVIKSMSKRLIKSLGEKNELAYLNYNKKEFFGQEFSPTIDHIIEKMTNKSQNQQNIVPIVSEQGSMKLKKFKILWEPSLGHKSKYMIRFSDDNQINNGSFLIYHLKSDTIKYFNEQFIKSYGIDRESFGYQLKNSGIFFNELFVNMEIPISEVKQYLKKQQAIIVCNLYLKKFIQNKKRYRIPVQICVFKCIYIEGELTYCILKIEKDDFISNSLRKKYQQKNSQKMKKWNNKRIFNESRLNQAKINQKQTFLCRIPNQYINTIKQKQSTWLSGSKWSYQIYIHIIFTVIITTLLTVWLFDRQFLMARIQKYKSQIIALQNTSQQYISLYQSYSLLTKRYLLNQHPNSYGLIKDFGSEAQDRFWVQKLKTEIDQFLQKYLIQVSDQSSSLIQYEIDFNHFSLKSKTTTSTLMDFIQHFRGNIANNQFDFLLKNYHHFRSLTIDYERAISYEQKITNTLLNYVRILIILSISTILCGIFMLIVQIKIESVIEWIYKLMNYIDKKCYMDNVMHFNKKQEQIKILFDPPIIIIQQQKKQKQTLVQIRQAFLKQQIQQTNKKQQKQQLRKPQHKNSLLLVNNSKRLSNYSVFSQKSNELEQKKQFKRTMNFINVGQSKTELSKSQILLKDDNDQILSISQSELNGTINQKPNQQTNSKKVFKIANQTNFQKLNKKLFFIVFAGFFLTVFLIDLENLLTQKKGIIQLFDIQKTLYISLLHVKREQVDAPIEPILQHFFKRQQYNHNNHHLTIDLVSEIPTKLIWSELQEFESRARRSYSQNLCTNVQSYENQMLKPCESYLNGMLAKGYVEAMDFYQNNARKLSNLPLSEFKREKCTTQTCSAYFEHELSGTLLGQKIREMLEGFGVMTGKVFEKIQERNQQWTVVKILGMVLVVGLYLYSSYELKQRSIDAISYFRIIPKRIMCRTKITTYMRKNDILEQFEIL